MPKITEEKSKHLLPYLFHGLDLDGHPQATGECPFCGKEKKFGVNVETGLWRCFSCEEKGNVTTFLRKLWEFSDESPATMKFLEDRKIDRETMDMWGVRQHSITGEACIPGYSADGKMMQLYRYEGKILKATSGVKHQLFGMNLWDPKKSSVIVCEGPWDAMKLWEVLGQHKRTDDGGVTKTGSAKASLLADVNVIAVPGCGSIGEPFERWCQLFEGKNLFLMFDSDHPKKSKDGKDIPPAGYEATKRAIQIILRGQVQPSSVEFLRWGTDGYDPERKSGYDVRDLLTEGDPARGLEKLFDLLEDEIPEEWASSVGAKRGKDGKHEIECLSCTDWKTLQTSWRKAMRWLPGLDKGLSVCLASVCSTPILGDQLWIMLLGPASCGKSTLCEAFSVNKRYVMSKSTMTGFHSGFKTDSEGKEDHSLIGKMNGKTLVIKDGDTLLQSPNLGQILSEARDIYDRVSRTHYRNGMGKDYEGINLTWLLCGTASLRKLDSSELGERFLKCTIMDGIDADEERDILGRVFHRSRSSLAYESNGRAETQHEPAMLQAIQLTGGYINYLRQNARELLAELEEQPRDKEIIIDLALFVAHMRARPSKTQDETVERELAARLTSQISRLAHFLAVVMNKKHLDDEVMARVKEVAFDTARGQTLEIVEYLDEKDREGAGSNDVHVHLNIEQGKCQGLLKFLRKIGVTERYNRKSKIGIKTAVKWRLTESIQSLYRRVHDAKDRSQADG